jgi:hypothetical protein
MRRLIVTKAYPMNYSTYSRDETGAEVETRRVCKFNPGDVPGMDNLPQIPDVQIEWTEGDKKKKGSKIDRLIQLGIVREYGQNTAVKEASEEEELLAQMEKESGLSPQEVEDFYKTQRVKMPSTKMRALEKLAGVGAGGGSN